MADRPILFSAPMVQALLAGHKTQTRRALAHETCRPGPALNEYGDWIYIEGDGGGRVAVRFAVSDRLWVREAFSGPHWCHGLPPRDWPFDCPLWYWADDNPDEGDWTPPKPGIHMPRWASRLTLTVSDVRVERLQDISEADARAEGIVDGGCLSCGQPEPCGCADASPDAVEAYAHLWDSINGKGAWVENPWVVAVTFSVVQRNIDLAPRQVAA
ncbi:hypothetical protein ACLNGM_14900 [Aureimonas phyllosphaerae]|uniref:hypothetical protein n=1 Tax=Aureimonas phyllosphaerae TaxID=1166078 RepID=UPI003A5C1725